MRTAQSTGSREFSFMVTEAQSCVFSDLRYFTVWFMDVSAAVPVFRSGQWQG